MRARSVVAKVVPLMLIVALLFSAVPSPVAQAGQYALPPQDVVQQGQPPLQRAALGLAITVAPEEVPVGGTATVTVRVGNYGNLGVAGAVVSGILPAGFDCPGCESFFDPDSWQLRWTLSGLEAG